MSTEKPIHTLVLDTGAIIRNEPPVSTLLAQSESLVTVPEIISEIRDAATRSRVQTTLLPFLTLRSPSPTSVRFVTEFARRTGDSAVLSKADVLIVALTYEIECERNRGDWRLRRVPGQKGVNGAPPVKDVTPVVDGSAAESIEGGSESIALSQGESQVVAGTVDHSNPATQTQDLETSAEATSVDDVKPDDDGHPAQRDDGLANAAADLSMHDDSTPVAGDASPKVDSTQPSASSQEDSESDSEGWITPSNLKKRQAQDSGASTSQTPEPKTMQVAVLTTDFAMQNVILQINLNLLSRSLTRVKHLKTFVLRCHACFNVTKDMSKQFCPRCGQPTLTRVSCSTNANGEFKLHLKKNMQWNTRGDRYSIPKAVHGAANGRIKGGGKGGWGNDLILAEDQKEYERVSKVEQKQKERSLMLSLIHI